MIWKPKLSVLIPAYDPGEWLRYILDILDVEIKRYPDTEIVIVDDGSTEDLSWVKERQNVVYYRQDNNGEGSARNRLLELARGEYIQFLDADDVIYPGTLDAIYCNIRKGFDFVSYDWQCDGHTDWAVQNHDALIVNSAVWAYTFRREYIKGHWFREDMPTGADTEWLQRTLTEDAKHWHDDSVFYNYRWMGNENSLCHKKLRGEL